MGYSYFMPTRIFFGAGSVNKLSRAPLPGRRALLVTGGTSTTRLGYVDKVREALAAGGASCVIYDKVQPNPTVEGVREGAALCAGQGCDFVVGLGGGSSIDTAKAIAVAAANDGDYWDYVSGGTGGGKKPASALPVIAITTTAGTGTEADPWAVVTNGNEKIGAGFDCTFPALSIVDPELMQTVPPHLTAYQGFDALFHACEGYIAKCASPFSDLYALKSIELVGKSLAAAVRDGKDMDARSDMALANTLAGFVESMSSCTGEHGMEHALSAFHPSLPHGAGLIMLSKAYFSVFQDDCADRYIDMARALGRRDAGSPADFLDALGALQTACGVDGLKLSDYGVEAGRAGEYADNALDTMGGLFRLDPRTLTRAEIISIFQKSYR